VRFTALQAGDVDIIERTPYEWVQQIVQGKIKGIGYARAPIAGARNLEFNVPDPPFNNKKLRLAIAYALDKQEIMQAAYFGLAETTDQRFPKGSIWYFDVPTPKYNLNKAKALLKESGYNGETLELMGNRGEVAEVEGAQFRLSSKKSASRSSSKSWSAPLRSRRDARENSCSSSPAAAISRTLFPRMRNTSASRILETGVLTSLATATKNMTR
jgi:ABC-type oligopeptide transport system substrate-binding subunit